MKLLVNQNWEADETTTKPGQFGNVDQENMGALNAQQKFNSAVLGDAEKGYLKQNIFQALDAVVHLTDHASKVIVSSIENMIYNVAQCDFEDWGAFAQKEIYNRLTSNDERFVTSGLRALKSII